MPSSRFRWTRWGWLSSTAALGAALFISAWIARERAAKAANTINRGQGEAWLQSVRQVAREFETELDQHALDSLLASRRADGLRAVALFDSSGALLAHVGDSLTGPPAGIRLSNAPGPPPFRMEDLGQTIRLTGVVFVGRPGVAAGGRPGRLLAVLSFVPIAATQLVAEATETLVLSLVVAATLLAAALLFWRLMILREDAEQRLEQQQRLGLLGQMSAVLAHEIRNPLASLKGHAQLLSERLDERTPDGAKARLVVREAERLEVLTNDLLGFARSGSITTRPTDPGALLQSCADEVAPDGFVVRMNGAPPAWPLDVNRMRQALTNVLRNARQASPTETRPEVSAGVEQGRLVFTIRDFGPGIPAGDERRIFEPFYTTRTNGTGLGLAVAARVVDMHEGVISVRNHPGGGAVFTIAIPRARD